MKNTNGILAVHNWAKYQHYKNRRPPWIKLSTHVFQDYKFARLTNDSKLLLICIWTMASDSEHGTVPDDLQYIREQGCLGKRITQANLDQLLAVGLLERFKDASEMLERCASKLLVQSQIVVLAPDKQNDCLETETEGDRTLASTSVLAETDQTPLPPFPQTTQNSPTQNPVSLPDWIPCETWQAYLDMRKKIRKPLTDHATKLAIGRLKNLRNAGNAPQAVLEQSILNDWTGLFELRRNKSNGESKNQRIIRQANASHAG